MKKMISSVLAMIMLVSFCSFASAEENPTISYWVMYSHAAGENSYVEQVLENRLGINIDLNTTPSTENEAVSLMLSNDMPDCISINRSYAFMADEQELVRSIPIEIVREYAPNLTAVMDADPILWAMCQDPHDETALYCLPDIYDTNEEMYPRAIFLRYDWIQNLGIDLGDVNVEQLDDHLYIADKGLSRDVFTQIVTKFVKDDPDGNGVADTYGIIDEWNRLMTSFGITTQNANVDGVATPWYVDERCKDFLAYMNSLYNDGLLHPELFTMSWGMNWEILKNGNAGIMLSSSTHYLNSWCSGRWPYAPLNGEIEDIQDILMIPGVLDENGKNVCPFFIGHGFASGNGQFWINADADDETMINCVKFYDQMFIDDPELQATLFFGEKDVDWKWNAEGDAPERINTLPMGEKGAMMFCLPVQRGYGWKYNTYGPDFKLGVKYYVKSEGGIWNNDLVVDYKRDIFNETDATAISNEFSADWDQIRNNYFISVITGEKNLDSDWDAYIVALNEAHFDEYMEELNKAPVVADVVAAYTK